MPHSTFRSFHLQASCDDFSRIVANNIPIDQNQFGLIEISVTSVNFQNVIRTLRTDVTITIKDITYQSRRECKNITPMIWCGVLGDIIYNVARNDFTVYKLFSQYFKRCFKKFKSIVFIMNTMGIM